MKMGKPITKKAVAERYGVSTRTINLWMNCEHLPYHKIGEHGRVFFYAGELDEWDEGHRHNKP